MTQEDAEAVARWRYPAPFSFYDWDSDPDDLAELLDPALRGEDYVAVVDDDGHLVGYFQYKRPHRPSLEIGLGLRPVRGRVYLHRTGGREWEFIEMRRKA
jgi:ribosomal-protein-alanine N-acetyltransferase